MKNEDGTPAGQPSPRPALPDTSKELLRKLAEELLLLHGQAETAEARVAAAEAQAAALQQRLGEAQAAAAAAGGPGGDGAAPNWQQLLADAQRRARQAEEAAAAAESEAASLRAQLIDSQQQLVAAQQEAAAARRSAEEAEGKLAEAQRQADAAQLQAGRAADKAADVMRQLAEVQRQLEGQAPGHSAPPARPAQRPEDVLTLRAKLNEERRQRRKAEAEVGDERRLRRKAEAALGEHRQRQAVEALTRSLRAQLDEQLDVANAQREEEQRRQGRPAPAAQHAQPAAALAREGAALPAGQQQERHEEQAPSPAATEPYIHIDLAATDDEAAEAQQQQRRQGGGGTPQQWEQHSAPGSEDGQAAGEHAGAAAEAAAQQQQQPAGEEGMRPPAQRVGRLRGPMRPAGSAPGAPAAGLDEGLPEVATAAQHRKRQAERGSGEAPAPASAPPPTARSRPLSGGGAQAKRRRGAVEASPDSPGESAMDVAAVLQRQLRRNSSAAAAAVASAGARGPSSLLLELAAAGEEEDGEEGGRVRRGGRRSASGPVYTERGVSGGGVVLKPGESARDWLNRTIVAYVGTLLSSRDFAVFRKPVDTATVPDYPQVVRHPMDLGTIKGKASEGRYHSPREFQDDLHLVVSNAQLYNESPRHPVHLAATLLMETLRKPHSFYSKVANQFRQAEMTATLEEEKARQEAEIEALERRLAKQVRPGLNLAVYAEDDDRGNKYFLMQVAEEATKPTLTLTKTEVDDFGNEFKRGDTVVVGHYYDYWLDDHMQWDSSRRPYYLQLNRTGYVPATSLLLVDFELRARQEPEMSPRSGRAERIYEAGADLHAELRRQIKKMTAEPVVSPRSP